MTGATGTLNETELSALTRLSFESTLFSEFRRRLLVKDSRGFGSNSIRQAKVFEHYSVLKIQAQEILIRN